MGAGSRFSSARYSATTNAVPLTSSIAAMNPSEKELYQGRIRAAVFRRVVPKAERSRASMRQGVDQVVDSELVRLVGLVERPQTKPRPLPELRHVGVVVDDRHQPLAA